MYLLRGTVKSDILTISAIYDLSHPRNAWVDQSIGYVVATEPSPPVTEGYYYVATYNTKTGEYIYTQYPFPSDEPDTAADGPDTAAPEAQ